MSSPGPIAIFGITNDTLNLFVSLLLLFFVAVYVALIYWTYSDARRRMEDPMLVGCATAASLFPFIGTIVYMIVRPPEYIEDVRERELEIAAAEARLHETGVLACPYCNFEIEKSFLRCPSCLRRLKEACNTCGKPLDPTWKLCPYCESELGSAPPPRRRRPPDGAAARPPGERPARRPEAGERAARVPREGRERPPRPDSERPARAEASAPHAPSDSSSSSRRPARSTESRSGSTSEREARSSEKKSGSDGKNPGSGGSRSKKPRERPPSRPPSSSS